MFLRARHATGNYCVAIKYYNVKYVLTFHFKYMCISLKETLKSRVMCHMFAFLLKRLKHSFFAKTNIIHLK